MTTDKTARKERPIARGVLDYFPDAITEVAHVSFKGNQQHNPGEEMHWAKEKSRDHADCIARHLIERGTLDSDGLRHSAKTAWRALAMLQIEIEAEADSRSELQKYVESEASQPHVDSLNEEDPGPYFDRPERERDLVKLIGLGCPREVARQIVVGTTYFGYEDRDVPAKTPYIYLAGPMRGYVGYNFAAFDAARNDLVAKGYNVISPADIDRAAGHKDDEVLPQTTYAFRDFMALHFIRHLSANNMLVTLKGWDRSVGATAEYGIAKWLGLIIREFEPLFLPMYDGEYTRYGMRYRVQGDTLTFWSNNKWVRSLSFTISQVPYLIKTGEFVKCVPSSSETSTAPSPTPATSVSAKTCTKRTNATT